MTDGKRPRRPRRTRRPRGAATPAAETVSRGRAARFAARIAVVFRRAGEVQQALQIAGNLGDAEGAEAGDLLELAELCLAADQPATAHRLLEAAVREDPTSARATEMLAESHVAGGAPEAALAALEPLYHRGALRPTGLSVLAMAYERLGRPDAAYRVAVRYAQAVPLDPYGHFRLAVLEQRAGAAGRAMARYQLAFELSGDDDGVREAARDSIRTLDAIQLQQITALAAASPLFRLRLKHNAADALDHHGFSLTDQGRAMLSTVDLDDLAEFAPSSRHVGH